MNNLKNKVQLIGNLGINPEIKDMDNGRKMARMTMATNESYKNAQGERVTETTWHNLVAWGPVADLAGQLLQKGSELMIEGKLTNRQYADKDGNTRYITEVVLHNFLLLDKKAAPETATAAHQ